MADVVKFLIYPGLDDNYNFPSVVNEAIAHSPEMTIAFATKSEFSAHVTNVLNPHNTTKAQVGLSNVDNTSDLDKPVSRATATAINEVSVVANEALGLAQSPPSSSGVDGGAP